MLLARAPLGRVEGLSLLATGLRFSHELLEEPAPVGPFPKDHEERVISTERPYDVLDLELVDAEGDARRVAHLGLDDCKVGGKVDTDDLASHIVPHEGIRAELRGRINRVDVFPALVRNSSYSEELQVTGKGGLGYFDALPFQAFQKRLLTVDLLRMQDVVDQPTPRFLTFQISPPYESPVGLHGKYERVFVRDAN